MLRIAALLVLGLVLNGQQLVTLTNLPGGGACVGEGRVVLRGTKATLVTVFGELRIERDAAMAARDSAPERLACAERAAQIPKGFAAGHAALARWCVDRGLFTMAREQMELALAIDPGHKVVHEAAAKLAERFGPVWLVDVRRDDIAETLLLQRAAIGRSEAAIALAAAQHVPAAELFRPALKALKLDQPHARWTATKVLARLRTEPLRIKPLFMLSLADATPVVRREAARALAATADPVFVKLYAKNLTHPEGQVRCRAAEAIAELGLAHGVAPLLAAFEDSWKPARANLTVTQQTAYLKDFDVEVAQGAVIADPVIDIVQSGVVLDVAVVSIVAERQVYRGALARLLKHDFGDSPAAWRAALPR